MKIRNMKLDDYDAVYAIWISCPGMGLNDVDDSREGIERFLARNPESCFVAEDGGEVVGVILAGNDGRRGYIYHTAVQSGRQREGIATALVNAAMDALERLGISKAALVVFDRNEIGNAFGENIGFSVRHDLVYRNRSIVPMKRIDT
ncbi:Ribosomal protein S18 acetylase RimI [Ruminococcaceae bacterium FB2012]|nr:Ribosomal protein S18 acetylase RimI [Ruminococcaceae bacterium FB2012]